MRIICMERIMSGDQAERIWGLIPAAGSGERMGKERPKQYLQLLGVFIIAQSQVFDGTIMIGPNNPAIGWFPSIVF